MKSDSEKAMKMIGVNGRVDWQILRKRKRIDMEGNSKETEESFEAEGIQIEHMYAYLNNF